MGLGFSVTSSNNEFPHQFCFATGEGGEGAVVAGGLGRDVI